MAGFGSRFHWLRFRRIRGLGGGRLGYGRSELPGVNVGEPCIWLFIADISKQDHARPAFVRGWMGGEQAELVCSWMQFLDSPCVFLHRYGIP